MARNAAFLTCCQSRQDEQLEVDAALLCLTNCCAKNREGNPIPWELVEQSIRASHPYEVFMLRSMLAVRPIVVARGSALP